MITNEEKKRYQNKSNQVLRKIKLVSKNTKTMIT